MSITNQAPSSIAALTVTETSNSTLRVAFFVVAMAVLAGFLASINGVDVPAMMMDGLFPAGT